MTVARKMQAFLEYSPAERALIVEAAIALAIARAAVALLPHRWRAPLLTRHLLKPVSARMRQVFGFKSCLSATPELISRVRRAVDVAGRNVPWSTACLPRSIAAKRLLDRRGVASALHVGARKGPDSGLLLHAWLDVNGAIVVGDGEKDAFTPVVRFDLPRASSDLTASLPR